MGNEGDWKTMDIRAGFFLAGADVCPDCFALDGLFTDADREESDTTTPAVGLSCMVCGKPFPEERIGK